jgi:hypothetical protein
VSRAVTIEVQDHHAVRGVEPGAGVDLGPPLGGLVGLTGGERRSPPDAPSDPAGASAVRRHTAEVAEVRAGPGDSGEVPNDGQGSSAPGREAASPAVAPTGARPLIINAHHKAGQLIIVGAALEARQA